jgi:predicted phosphodiesterase
MGMARIYFIHDKHFGSELFDEKKWEIFKKLVLSQDNSFVCWVGDLMENAVPNSKSDMFTQKYSPAQQKEWVTQQFVDFGEKTLVVVPGNHEYNRTTKVAGLYPLYDCCLIAGIGDKYRNIIGYMNIGIGTSKKDRKKQIHYFGQVQHKAKDCRAYGTSDFTDGIDFFAYGHDHQPSDKPRAKMVFDKHNNVIYKQNIENIDCGSGCVFGGYGANAGYRPQSDKIYELLIFGNEKRLDTHGFYV